MKRRSLLSAVAVAALPSRIRAQPAKKVAVRVSAGEDRNGEQIRLGTSPNHCKVSGKDTNGALAVFEGVSTTNGGPPLHVHREQEEWFYVVAGEYAFQIGEEKFRLKAGDSVLAPRLVPHTFANVGGGEGRMLCTFQPAGDMEAFFREVGKFRSMPTREQWEKLFSTHGMTVVGPPLSTA